MERIIERGTELYRALNAGDGEALTGLLTGDFVGVLTAGLPHGLGGRYEGLDVMLADGWGRVDEAFDLRLEVDGMIDAGATLVGRGHYVGAARATGRPLHAAFAHFWSFDGDRFTGLAQVTDSGVFRDAVD